MVHIVATGAGKAMMDRRSDPTHDYVLELTGKQRPRVLFLGTATGDRPDYILSFYQTFHSDRCAPHHLPLFARDRDDLRSWITEFDVIHVGGGNTANMLDVWRRQGVDEILTDMFHDPANENVVFTGGSAGGICWFEGGTTDSYGPTLRLLPESLGLLDGSFSPHYDAEDQRRPLVHAALKDGTLPTGWACGNLDSLHFNGTEFVTAITSQKNPLALRLTVENGEVVETPLPVLSLGA